MQISWTRGQYHSRPYRAEVDGVILTITPRDGRWQWAVTDGESFVYDGIAPTLGQAQDLAISALAVELDMRTEVGL